jgi:hypothetical protein
MDPRCSPFLEPRNPRGALLATARPFRFLHFRSAPDRSTSFFQPGWIIGYAATQVKMKMRIIFI